MSPVRLVKLETDHLLVLTGPDREKFLQGQVTTDMREVTPEQSRLGCICNLKGRVLFSFRSVAWQDKHFLLMDAGLAEAARLHLQKYIIFSKATLGSAVDIDAWALIGEDAGRLLQEATGLSPQQADAVQSNDRISVICLAPDRYLLLAQHDSGDAAIQSLAPLTTPGTLQDWRLSQVRSGEVQILAAASELFQPQEINYPALQGVSYNKGCYTGQEIIARLYFRGKLKQWVHRFRLDSQELPEINAALMDEAGRVAGHVVMAADAADHVEILATARYDQLAGLQLGGRALTLLTLPYGVDARE